MIYIVQYLEANGWQVAMDVFMEREKADEYKLSLEKLGIVAIVSARRVIY